jgi:hypothetical protein
MLYALIGEDAPGSLDKRMAVRPNTSPASRPCRPTAA